MVYNNKYNIPDSLIRHNLHDGKLNKSFFTIFLFELFRVYLSNGPSYRNPNISKILKYTVGPGPAINYRKESINLQSGNIKGKYLDIPDETFVSPIYLNLREKKLLSMIKHSASEGA